MGKEVHRPSLSMRAEDTGWALTLIKDVAHQEVADDGGCPG